MNCMAKLVVEYSPCESLPKVKMQSVSNSEEPGGKPRSLNAEENESLRKKVLPLIQALFFTEM